MEQLSILRDLAETAVLRTLAEPSEDRVAELHLLNDKILSPGISIEEAMRLNRDFHFTIFELVPLHVLIGEIDPWWKTSAG